METTVNQSNKEEIKFIFHKPIDPLMNSILNNNNNNNNNNNKNNNNDIIDELL